MFFFFFCCVRVVMRCDMETGFIFNTGQCCLCFVTPDKTQTRLCFCTRCSRTHCRISGVVHVWVIKSTQLAYLKLPRPSVSYACGVTLDLQDHRGANPHFVYFFSCRITNRHVVLVRIFFSCICNYNLSSLHTRPKTPSEETVTQQISVISAI